MGNGMGSRREKVQVKGMCKVKGKVKGQVGAR